MTQGRVSRREFLRVTGVGALAGAGVLPLRATAAKGAQIQWTMVTSWPPNFPILQTGAERFARLVEELSEGALTVQVYAGGELVPPLGVFEAVSSGTVEAGSSAAYYWAGTVPAAQFFTAVPFGLPYDRMTAWLHAGGGLELWTEIYEPFNLVPYPLINTGVQAGGWFNREINSLDDLQGLKMRIPGLGGKVYERTGVSVVLLPGAEIFTALQTGTIDAAEWVGPYHDYLFGFPQIAKYYYHPGWHEPGAQAELIVNKAAWDALPKELQAVVKAAADAVTAWSYAEFDVKNAEYLAKIREEYPDVEVRTFPDEVLDEFFALTQAVFDEQADQDRDFARVYEAYLKFREGQAGWWRAEYYYHYYEYGKVWAK